MFTINHNSVHMVVNFVLIDITVFQNQNQNLPLVTSVVVAIGIGPRHCNFTISLLSCIIINTKGIPHKILNCP